MNTPFKLGQYHACRCPDSHSQRQTINSHDIDYKIGRLLYLQGEFLLPVPHKHHWIIWITKTHLSNWILTVSVTETINASNVIRPHWVKVSNVFLYLQQLNDSSVIISILESYLEDPSQSIGKLLSFYPALESKEGRKTVYEFPNKYFIMYGEKEPSSTQKQLK